MGFIIVIIILVLFVFVNIKLNNFKERAKQEILKNTGLSSSDISTGVTNSVEKKHLENFLREHPEYTEESIRELLKEYSIKLFNKNLTDEFSEELKDKAISDSKLDKMQAMEFKRANINYYGNSKLNTIVVFTNNRDEYNVYLYCNIIDGKIQVNKYQITKGAVVGF